MDPLILLTLKINACPEQFIHELQQILPNKKANITKA